MTTAQADLSYDVVVIGGGHAGVEAAAAAARLGARTALLTQSLATIGAMSCNPAIGGIGKGHLVREIDALDGLMGRAADRAGIQFRLLNRRKGPAVRGPRTQADRKLYARAIKGLLEAQAGLDLVEGEADDLILLDGRVAGIRLLDGRSVSLGSLVVATGTFLGGLIHIGERHVRAGRFGERPSDGLSGAFGRLGLPLGRLKTGTPPRLDGRTIDWAGVDRQAADDVPTLFSLMSDGSVPPQIECGVTRTTPAIHEHIRRNLHRSPLFGGAMQGRGPRYCPSIEDKVVRFADKDSHQIFLEPEGLDDPIVYPNGISTSLPEDVQEAVVHAIPGLERCCIVRPGYAIEYDYVDPRALDSTLALKAMPNLFLAGQINGTTGYEEAAGQGIVAGLNAALLAGGGAAERFDRSTSYIGVMIDDLVTRGVSEPYRMFTSRSEFRLSLRVDNADERMTPVAARIGAASPNRLRLFASRSGEFKTLRDRLESLTASPQTYAATGIDVNHDGTRRSAFQMLGHPGVDLRRLAQLWPELQGVPRELADRVETEGLYAAYLARQDRDAASFRREEQLMLPSVLPPRLLEGISTEIRSKIESIRPSTLGQAARIEGMTPAALTLLAAAARRQPEPAVAG